MRQPSLRQPYPLFGRGNRIRHWRRHHTKYNTIYKCNCRAVHNLPAHKFHTFLGHIRNSELGIPKIMILMMLIMLSSFISYSELLLEFLIMSFLFIKIEFDYSQFQFQPSLYPARRVGHSQQNHIRIEINVFSAEIKSMLFYINYYHHHHRHLSLSTRLVSSHS